MATLAEVDLKVTRRRDDGAFADNDQRSAVIMIHPGRINTANSPERAWHWTATRMGDLLELDVPRTEQSTGPRLTGASLEGVPA